MFLAKGKASKWDRPPFIRKTPMNNTCLLPPFPHQPKKIHPTSTLRSIRSDASKRSAMISIPATQHLPRTLNDNSSMRAQTLWIYPISPTKLNPHRLALLASRCSTFNTLNVRSLLYIILFLNKYDTLVPTTASPTSSSRRSSSLRPRHGPQIP